MAYSARERLAQILAAQDDLPASVQLRPRPPQALRLRVDGLGQVALPVPAEQARRLRRLGRPARYGRGEQTLTDSAVRDTWEVPRELVDVEWPGDDGLDAALGSVREHLGLPDGCRLTAELHSLLVYEKGQFFLPHQDSEKDDAMVATLVVTLPSRHDGGELVVHHLGETTAYRGAAGEVSMVAFYSDCRHEVRPVTSGCRVTLTYNLLLHGAPIDRVSDDAVLTDAVAHLRSHFGTAVPRRGSTEPPRRLVFLLDHEYTERGLCWDRLKGTDSSRAALLRAAAEVADCEAVLALTEVHQIWDAYEVNDRYRSWHDDEDDQDDQDDGDGEYEVNDLIDSSVELTWWTAADGSTGEAISLTVPESEVTTATASSDLTPYASEHEGYMGNYGNTLDRWYRRAAVIVTPNGLGFAHRAEASAGWALRDLAARTDPDAARQDAATLAPFWGRTLAQVTHPAPLLPLALTVADLVADPDIATLLLAPFPVEVLATAQAPALAALTGRYGTDWAEQLLRGWLDRSPLLAAEGRPSRIRWLAALPDLTGALRAAGDAGTRTAELLAGLGWHTLRGQFDGAFANRTPSTRRSALERLGSALSAVVTVAAETADSADSTDLLDSVVTYCRRYGDHLERCLLVALATVEPDPARPRRTAAFGALAADRAAALRARLAAPARSDDDWSVTLPPGCDCDRCGTLRAFLADPGRRAFEWPLAKPDRSHVHSRIDLAELPVRHLTRRTGRPYTLVLTKTQELFDQAARQRAQDVADTHRLANDWP